MEKQDRKCKSGTSGRTAKIAGGQMKLKDGLSDSMTFYGAD